MNWWRLFRLSQISIVTKGRSRMTVPAFIMEEGPFAIHRFATIGGPGENYVVTHVASGMRMPGGPWIDPRDAAAFCVLAMGIEGVDWATPKIVLTPEQRRQLNIIAGRTA